jgi:HEAT repeat protein
MFRKNSALSWYAALLTLTVTVCVANRASSAQAPVNSAEKERELIAVLQSGAPASEKAVPCKLLAVYGSDAAVPALAPLLMDEKLASWARIALEAIPGESASEALRAAVPKLQGRLLVGTINSIGVRHDSKAIGELASRLKDPDPEVASSAAVALGRIGGPSAASALKGSLSAVNSEVRTAVAEGCIRCAEQFLAAGQPTEAIELYDLVRKADVPKQKTLEAIRGAILARKDAGIPLLVEQLRSSDKALFQIGLRVARELPGTKATRTVVDEMHRAVPDRQPMLLLALADRGDDSAMPEILESARTGPKKLRIVAVGILDRMGKLSSVPVLIDVASGNDPELSQAALVALTRMPGTELDTQILRDLETANARTRLVLIQLSARRQVQGAIPLVVKDCQSTDQTTRSAAVQALGSLGGTAQVSDLVKLFSGAQNEKQRQDLEDALLAISSRLGAGCAQSLLPLTQSQDTSVRKVTLHALASAGGADALTAVKAAVDDPDESVRDEAVRTLSTWPNTWPEDETIAEPLLNLAKASKKSSYRVLAMRGYLQFLQGDKKLSGGEQLAKVQEAMPLLGRPEEKRSAIAIVQSVPTGAALKMQVALASEPEVTEDACSAIVDMIGHKMSGVPGEAKRQALETVVEKSKNEDTRKKATQALAQIH